MIRIIFIVAAFFIGLISGKTQTPWTLEQCIRYALKNNVEIKQQQVNIDKQKIQQTTAQYSRLPNLMLDGTQRFDFGRTLNRDNTYNDTNSQNSAFSLNSEVSLFSGFKTTATIKQEGIKLQIQTANMERIYNDISLRITQNYFQVLLNKEMVSIAEEQVFLSKELVEITRELVAHGKVAASQLLDVEAQVANDQLTLTKAQNTLRMSLLEISQMMELRDITGFEVADISITTLGVLTDSPEQIYQIANELMPEINSARLGIKSAEQGIRIARSGYYPSLALAGEINSGYYRLNKASNPSFKEQFRNNLQQRIYLTLRIPLFNRLSTRNSIRTARKEQEESQLALLNTEKQLYKEIQKAWYDALSARDKFKSTQKAVEANEEALRYALEKYHAGKFTAYEYNEIKLKWANSRSEQAQAKYENMLQRKLLDFYKGKSIY